jgi:prepilin-type N-terminal cleavage/methylation domain-containing protein
MKRKLKGFTLTELVIVLAIIGILAGIGIPNMLVMVRRAKFNAANTEARTIFKAAQTVMQGYEISRNPKYSDDLYFEFSADPRSAAVQVREADDTTTVKASLDQIDINAFVRDVRRYNEDLEQGYWRIKTNKYLVQQVYWAEGRNDTFVGSFPVPNKDTTTGGISSCTYAFAQTAVVAYYD